MGIKIFLGVLLLANVLAWIFLVPYLSDRRLRRFQEDLLKGHYDEIRSMYTQMRAWRHDTRNHIQTVKAQLMLGESEEALHYLDSLESDLTRVDTVLKTGNVMVDAILNSKLTLMRDRKIPVDATARVPGEIGIGGVDLSVILGNLLDNAMEAVMAQAESDRFIRIYIDIVRSQLYISVTNSMQGRAKRVNGHFLSSKAGHSGFGLMRIDRTVKRYGGVINRQSEEGVFATEVLLPLHT